MTFYVVVSGLPKTVKKQKMSHFFRHFIFKKSRIKFWIESMQPSTHCNEMVIRFETEAHADIAARSLQDYPFQHTDQQIYILRCWLRSDKPARQEMQNFEVDVSVEREFQPVEPQRPYSPVTERDSSPHLRDELTKLQLEIELTNKRRLLLEAERQLVLEQKSLEMLQANGSTAVVALEETTTAIPKNKLHIQTSKLLNPQQKIRECNQPRHLNNKLGLKSKHLYWPCKILWKEMKPIIRDKVIELHQPQFNALFRNVVKKRLHDILQDGFNHNTKGLISRYRKTFPAHMDEEFVVTLRNTLLQGQLSTDFSQKDTSNANMTNTIKEQVDPTDLPISEMCDDLADWTED
ncbi:unnamed protein product [Leptosia nina]|uniref:Uncharacterized protein n=1 Tax=Leptosia nina TaxID=320188 RepID=A0AAV1JI72_9NEOP